MFSSSNKNIYSTHRHTSFLLFALIEATIFSYNCHALAPSMVSSSIPKSRPLFYQDDKNHGEHTNPISQPFTNTKKIKKGRKSIVGDLKSLDDLKFFLEDDDRLVAVKFFAPWCKSCQKLGKNFDRLAMEMADTIVDRQMVPGKIRCAQVECRTTHSFVTEQLYVMALPTLHLYHGTQKIWEASGQTDTKELRKILSELEENLKTPEELQTHAELTDDGILTNALEDTMFGTYPAFLDEEW